MKSRLLSDDAEPSLLMEPMVDVVFLVLVFFLFSFQIRLLERLYWVQSPEIAPSDAGDRQTHWQMILHAGRHGELAAVSFHGRRYTSLADAGKALRRKKQPEGPVVCQVFLVPDRRLSYGAVIQAAMTVRESGYKPSLLEAQINP